MAERNKEVILQNTILQNVMHYLLDKLRVINGLQKEKIFEDGTKIWYLMQTPLFSHPNKIKVNYTSTVIPKGDENRSYGFWQDLTALSFEGMQLQTNTVKVKATCEHPCILSEFDSLWADLLKDFGAVKVDGAKHGEKESGESVSSIRDALEIIQEAIPLGLLLYKSAKDVVDISPLGFMPIVNSLSPSQKASRIFMSYA
jgi:hypothetical protein